MKQQQGEIFKQQLGFGVRGFFGPMLEQALTQDRKHRGFGISFFIRYASVFVITSHIRSSTNVVSKAKTSYKVQLNFYPVIPFLDQIQFVSIWCPQELRYFFSYPICRSCQLLKPKLLSATNLPLLHKFLLKVVQFFLNN